MNNEFKFNLEEMLNWCEPEPFVRGYGPDEIRKSIAKALRAGQFMAAYCDDEVEEILRNAGFNMTADAMREARQAWDQSIEGEV